MKLSCNRRSYVSQKINFNQGQLVVILSLPNMCNEDNQTISVKLVPPGIRNVNVENLPSQCQSSHKEEYMQTLAILNILYIRYKFLLDYYVAITVHKCIRETVPYVATRLCCVCMILSIRFGTEIKC